MVFLIAMICICNIKLVDKFFFHICLFSKYSNHKIFFKYLPYLYIYLYHLCIKISI